VIVFLFRPLREQFTPVTQTFNIIVFSLFVYEVQRAAGQGDGPEALKEYFG